MPLSKFDWKIAGPDRPQLGCAPPPGGGVEYKIEYTAENARLLHIVWNKVVLEHQPGGSAPAERSAIDFEGDSPVGRSYYRLNVITITLPPLRERRDDIPLLIDHFLRRPVPVDWQLTGAAHRALCNYSWPGNIRELANVIERAKILAADQRIDLEQLPEAILDPAETEQASPKVIALAGKDDLSLVEREHVAAVLKREGGNKARAAKALGVSRRSLYRLIEKYGIDPASQSAAKIH